jgi:hypothetical protein
MKVGAAHPAGGDPHPHLAIARLGIRTLHELERFAEAFQNHCLHRSNPP